MSYFEAYLIFQVFDKISTVVSVIAAISCIFLIVLSVFTVVYWSGEIRDYKLTEDCSDMKNFRFLQKGVKILLAITMIFSVMNICIPDTNTALKIIGAKYATNNEDMQEITDSLPKLIKEKIADELKENQK